MKILHVLHAYPPSTGGIQWLFQNISERLVRDFGDAVTVYTTTAYRNSLFWDPRQPAMPAGAQLLGGVTVRRFPVWNHLPALRLNLARVAHKLHLPGEDWLRAWYFGPIVPGLSRAIAAAPVDVIAASAFPLLHMHVALRAARRTRTPIVLIGALHPADSWCFDRRNIYRAIRQAQAYIALSEFEREYIVQRRAEPQGDPDRIHVIGGGVDAARFRQPLPPRAVLRRRWGWAADDPAVIFLGRQAEHKRIDLLLAAMRLVWPQLPRARLLIAGARTDYTPQLKRQVAALPRPWQSRVTWVNDFSEAEKPAILAACDVLANPSAYESFGLVFLEAWAAGLPVVGARIGAISSLIAEEQDGLLAAYGDAPAWGNALTRLLRDRALRRQMGALGRAKVAQRYDWAVITRRFRAAYRSARATTD